MIVVMRLINGQDLAEVALAEDELLVEALAAQGADATFGVSMRARRLDRTLDDPNALDAKTASKARVNLASRSRMRHLNWLARSPRWPCQLEVAPP